MRRVLRWLVPAGVAALLVLGAPTRAAADSTTITITPVVVIMTDSNGTPVSTETRYPTASPTGASAGAPAQVTVTVTPQNPGVLDLGQNDAGQWVGILIGLILGVLGTVAFLTRREAAAGSDHPDATPPDEATPESETPPDAG